MAGQLTRNPSYSSEIRVWYGLKGNQDFINLDFPEIRGPISRNQKTTEIKGNQWLRIPSNAISPVFFHRNLPDRFTEVKINRWRSASQEILEPPLDDRCDQG